MPVAAPTPPPAYLDIEDVPEAAILAAAFAIVTACGATEPEDLYGAVARRLGFKRLGGNIRKRVERSVAQLARDGKLERQPDGRWGGVAVALTKS